LDLATRSVDIRTLVPCNKLLLLHGPPGTGKTSLCRALAQKLAIQETSARFSSGAQLIEVNAHSLFSRWFSESGKIVLKLFTKILEMASEDRESLFVVLLDEVESLCMSRGTTLDKGNEPSDAIRAVNAVLTQIDRIQAHPNILVFATSNFKDSLDPAFLDRCDLIKELKLPSSEACVEILASGVAELVRTCLITTKNAEDQDEGRSDKISAEIQNLLDYTRLRKPSKGGGPGSSTLSGRSLRKLPLVAYLHSRPKDPETRAVKYSTFMQVLEQELSKT